MDLSIRQLTEADVDCADDILRSAFSSESRTADLRRYLELQPDGWLLASAHGEPAGMVGAVDYGPFAYIGLMGVHQKAQHQGIGTALMQHLLDRLDRRGTPTALLDASEAGHPLYLRLGFVDCDRSLVYQFTGEDKAPILPPGVRRLQPEELEALGAFDVPIFGANRAKVFRSLLTAFPGRAFVREDEAGRISGYIFAQGRRLGPWAASRPQDAEALLQTALTLPFDGALSLVVPESNRPAIALLERAGLQLVNASHRHMRRGGERHPGRREAIYAQTSFAIG
jgi:ribosomal protein S18 acetylase RimI-like enzyme